MEIDRDNFNSVLAAMTPSLAFKVDNKLSDEEGQLAVELRFKSLDDFHPEQIVQQVPPLARLVETRRRLSALLNKLDGNDRLDELLQEAISSAEGLQTLGSQAGVVDNQGG